MNEVLTKPVNSNELLATLDRLVNAETSFELDHPILVVDDTLINRTVAQKKSCLSMKVRSPMPCSCSCLSPTRSQRRRRELHGADSDMAQRLETAMAQRLRLGSLAELHG